MKGFSNLFVIVVQLQVFSSFTDTFTEIFSGDQGYYSSSFEACHEYQKLDSFTPFSSFNDYFTYSILIAIYIHVFISTIYINVSSSSYSECYTPCPISNLSLLWCQGSSMARFLHIDPMVSGSSPTSARLSFRMRRVAKALHSNELHKNTSITIMSQQRQIIRQSGISGLFPNFLL